MEKKKPAKKFWVRGSAVSIWENQVQEKGATRTSHRVTIQRSFKDKEGKWKQTSALRVEDLPVASELLTQAYRFLAVRESEEGMV